MALSTIPTAGLSSDQGVNFRNLIINGDMSIAQRGTSASGLSGGGGLDTVDRFRRYINLAGTWTNTQSTDVPTGQGFANSWKWDCTTANASIGSTAEFSVSQRFEGQMLQQLKKGTSNAESLTVSFWVKSNKTGTYICELFDGGNSRHIGKAYTINSANTWEKKTITFEGDTTGTISNNNTTGLQLNWWLVAGTYWTSGTLQTSWGTRNDANRVVGQVNLADNTANEWYITGIQLEVGTSASDFEFLPYDVNLQRCKRYTHRIDGNGTNDTVVASCSMAGTQQVRSPFKFPVTMRTTPSVTESDLEIQDDANAHTASSLGLTFGACDSSICLVINADSGSPFTGGEAGLVKINNTTSGFLMFDAEL